LHSHFERGRKICSPPAAPINFILSIDPKKPAVAISHGHGDHPDDSSFGIIFPAHGFVPEFPDPVWSTAFRIYANPPSVLTDRELERLHRHSRDVGIAAVHARHLFTDARQRRAL
jgi:hypothetical protein